MTDGIRKRVALVALAIGTVVALLVAALLGLLDWHLSHSTLGLWQGAGELFYYVSWMPAIALGAWVKIRLQDWVMHGRAKSHEGQ